MDWFSLVESILSDAHFLATLIFGILLSASFLGITCDKQSVFKLSVFSVISSGLQLLAFKYWGADISLQLYPLLIHLPLLLFLRFAYHVPIFSCALDYQMDSYLHSIFLSLSLVVLPGAYSYRSASACAACALQQSAVCTVSKASNA